MLKFTKNFSRWFRRYAKIRNTINELSILNDRELSDIGISRSDIMRVARTHARGTLWCQVGQILEISDQ